MACIFILRSLIKDSLFKCQLQLVDLVFEMVGKVFDITYII